MQGYLETTDGRFLKLIKAKLVSEQGVPNPPDGSVPYSNLTYVYKIDGISYFYHCVGSYYNPRRNEQFINLVLIGEPCIARQVVYDSVEGAWSIV